MAFADSCHRFQMHSGGDLPSDEVLGAVESGVDLEKRIAEIYQGCRTTEQIKAAFDILQQELDTKIKAGLDTARKAFLENFDAEVHERLRVHKEAAKQSLDIQQQMLFDLAKFYLDGRATFDKEEPRFQMNAEAEGASLSQRFNLDWQRADKLGDTFFRIDHPLARGIIKQATLAETAPCDVKFFYESHASALKRYRGSTGWMEVSKLTTEAVGRPEEFLLTAACDSSGNRFPSDVEAKLFSLKGQVIGPLVESAPSELGLIQQELTSACISELEARNRGLFEEEAEKLDRWAEDLKYSLERELKELDSEIRSLRKNSKLALALAEKVEAQKLLKAAELRRATKRRQLFDAQDDVDKKRSRLIDEIERQLMTKAKLESVFTIRWTLAHT